MTASVWRTTESAFTSCVTTEVTDPWYGRRNSATRTDSQVPGKLSITWVRSAPMGSPGGAPRISVEAVNKHFGALHVLKDINLTVDRGQVIVVLGPSGSGKSTLCRTINRLETIDSGTIRIDGEVLPAEG